MSVCRECHQEVVHKLSCSISKYGDRRREVLPEDEVSTPHEPTTPYCPGPEIACYYGPDADGEICHYTGAHCYYNREEVSAS